MEYNFPDHISGDTFDGTSFTIKVNSSPLNLIGASVTLTLEGGKETITLSTLNHRLAFSDNPADGIVVLPRQVITVTEGGLYKYKIVFTLASGSIKTYITGQWKITKE